MWVVLVVCIGRGISFRPLYRPIQGRGSMQIYVITANIHKYMYIAHGKYADLLLLKYLNWRYVQYFYSI